MGWTVRNLNQLQERRGSSKSGLSWTLSTSISWQTRTFSWPPPSSVQNHPDIKSLTDYHFRWTYLYIQIGFGIIWLFITKRVNSLVNNLILNKYHHDKANRCHHRLIIRLVNLWVHVSLNDIKLCLVFVIFSIVLVLRGSVFCQIKAY